MVLPSRYCTYCRFRYTFLQIPIDQNLIFYLSATFAHDLFSEPLSASKNTLNREALCKVLHITQHSAFKGELSQLNKGRSGRIDGAVKHAGESDVSLRCVLVEGDGLTSHLCPMQFHRQGNEARNLAKQTTALHLHESHMHAHAKAPGHMQR